MARDPKDVLIYHITHIDNLPSILKDGGLHSDAIMAERDPKLIGYSEIKKRRLNSRAMLQLSVRRRFHSVLLLSALSNALHNQ